MANEHRSGDYNQLLSAYLDGEVTAAERSELLHHLATCAPCRTTMEQYRSIGTQLRALPPVQTPDDLTDAIYAQTVDAPPRRLSLLSSRAGYPLAAVAAVLLVFVVAVFLLVDGYQRRIDPTIVGSQPAGNAASINSEIRITFNKEMDRESVEKALTLKPTSELERLDVRWEGNTLIIGGAPLKPSTEYVVSFSGQARDKWGKPLNDSDPLAFGTSSTQAFESPATVTATPTAEVQPPAISPPSTTATSPADPTATPAPPTVTPEFRNQAVNTPAQTNTPVPPTQNGSGDGNDGSNGGTINEDTPPPPPPPSTATPVPTGTPIPEPTATTEPEPVETEVPTVTPAPTGTPIPEPTATTEPEPEPTEEPSPTAEPEPTATTEPDEEPTVEGSFGNVYWSNDLVRAGLGNPIDVAVEGVAAQELDFQNGKMFQMGADGPIYVMYTDGSWEFFPVSAGEQPESTAGSEEGLWNPGGVFGQLWNENPTLQEKLGQALERQTHVFLSTVQGFEGGTMASNANGFIYVIYTDNPTWELYPDAGPLRDGEPTAVPEA